MCVQANVRDSKLGGVVEDLFADKDDAQLDGQLQHTAVGGALVQSKTSDSVEPSWESCQTAHTHTHTLEHYRMLV